MAYVPIDVENINWDQYLSIQEGGESDRFFVGQRYMRGYGILGSIGKFLLPIAKNLASTVGTEGLAAGQNILKEVTEGKDFTEALKEHSKKGFENLSEKIKQCGKGKTQSGTARKRKPKSSTLGFNTSPRSRQRIRVKPTISMYPTRPASPTVPPLRQNSQGKRKRKPDQLDMF